MTDVELVELAHRLQSRCIALGLTVATAESCTGGLVGHALTEVPGSSAYYLGGVVSYSDGAKTGLLHVPEAVLAAHGAVSAQVAIAMAIGARQAVRADLGLSITGIAGPDGGSAAKPVGLTYVAAASPAGTEVRRHLWSGDRAANKLDSAAAALSLLLEVVDGLGRAGGPRRDEGDAVDHDLRADGRASADAAAAPDAPSS